METFLVLLRKHYDSAIILKNVLLPVQCMFLRVPGLISALRVHIDEHVLVTPIIQWLFVP